MIILDSNVETVQIVLSATGNIDYTSSYVDVDTSTYTPTGVDGNHTSGSVNTTVVSAPSSGQRQIKQLTFYNADVVSATITVFKYQNTTARVLCKVSLGVSDTLQYNDSEGFKVIHTTGGVGNILATGLGLSAGTQSNSSGTIVFSNDNNVSFGMANSSVITASVGNMNVSFWEVPHAELNMIVCATNSTVANSSLNLSFQRHIFPYNMTVTRLEQIHALTCAGNTAGSWTFSAAVYTRTQSTLNTASSSSVQYSWNSGGNTGNSNSYSGQSGTRVRSISANNWVFTPGEYWFAFMHSVAGVAGTTGSLSMAAQSCASVLPPAGLANDVVGQYAVLSAGTGAFRNGINLAADLLFAGTAAATASIVYRQPYFRMYGSY